MLWFSSGIIEAMKLTRKNFLRWATAAGAAAVNSALSSCGGGGSGGSGGSGAAVDPSSSPSAVSGAWSNPVTWGGSIPSASDAVAISSGHTVILDTAAICASVDIQGTLVADLTKSISLTAGFINVGANGDWSVGSTGAPYPSIYTCIITLNGAESGRTPRTVSGTTLGFTNSGVGRSIQVQPGGKLRFIGSAPVIKRTKLNASASNGATSFTLADSTGWKSGDEIVIGTTDFYGVASSQKLTLAANASGATITTSTGIAGARWGALQYVTDSGMSLTPGALTNPPAGAPTVLDERAFVAHLSRNIIVQGVDDDAWTNNKFGAHCMFMGRNSSIQLDAVQFRRVGQAGALGRYPVHWHMMSYNMPNGMNQPSGGTFLGAVVGSHYIKNCVIEESGQRMVVIHGTHGVTCDSNVGYDITGHALFLEDGAEQDNVITNNVVMKVRSPTAANRLLNSDQTAPIDFELTGNFQPLGTAGIWFSNPKNTLTGNWVNDSEGSGIWQAFASQCFGLSVNVAMAPNTIPITAISNNWAYGNKGIGIQTNRPQINDKGDAQDGTAYEASFIANPISDLKMFKNSAGGYSNRVFEAQYSGFICADNTNMDVFGQANVDTSFAQKFLVVAESLNNATSRRLDTKRSAFATYHELLNFKNGIAVGYDYITGSRLYDDNTFTGGGLFRMEDLYTQPVFTFSLNTGIKQINSTAPYRTRSANIDGYPIIPPSNLAKSRNWALAGVIKDVNGLFVPVGKYWVFNNPFFTYGLSGSTSVYAGVDTMDSNGVYTDDRFFGVIPTDHTADSFADSINILPITVLQQDAGGVTQGAWEIGDGAISPKLGNMRHFAVRNGGRYKVGFPGNVATSVAEFKVSLMDDVNDIFLLGVEFSGAVTAKVIQRAQQFNGRVGRVPSVPSLADRSAGIARQLNLAGSFANVVADTTGEIFWQDTSSDLVWFKVRVGSLALSYNAYPTGAGAPYKPVAIAVTS
jgi:hypothetical protein